MDIMKLLRQAQDMQSRAKEIQDEIESATYEGTAGGGAVTALVTGLGGLKSLKISPESADLGDLEMLEDLVVAAVRNAQDQAAAAREEKFSSLTAGLQGLNIPGLGF